MNRIATERVLQRVIPQLQALRDSATALAESFADDLAEIEPGYRDSALNLLHYLGVRQHDIRHLQQDLFSLGLSSLGVLEPHSMASLNAVLNNLARLTGRDIGAAPEEPVDFRTGPLLLRDHTRSLLGPDPANRSVRIMVTMPSEAATNPQLVQDLLAGGMNVMRINCAHDSPQAWAAMVANLRKAERALGRSCKVQADLAGPKLRTGRLRPAGQVLKLKPRRNALGEVVQAGQVWLTPADGPESPPDGVEFVVPVERELLARAGPGDQIRLQDARGRKRVLRVEARSGGSCLAEAKRPAYLLARAALELRRSGKLVTTGRVGELDEVVEPIPLFPGEHLILTRKDRQGRPAVRDEDGQVIKAARIHCTLEAAFERVRSGESVWFDDGKIGGIVKDNDGQRIDVEITHTGPQGAKLRAEKGINFPDTNLEAEALTEKDLADLEKIVGLVDMVALSFLRSAADVQTLEDHLHRLGGGHLGIVLKIENRQAFEDLPRILLASLKSPPVGVMVARGDLAVEVGFQRLSEVQEEILWLCEAAHVPVIWATQILEGLAKKGAPSRAEVTDAAMSSRAECAMLNKGPNIVETVAFLSGVLSRMDTHHYKRKALLRRLAISDLSR